MEEISGLLVPCHSRGDDSCSWMPASKKCNRSKVRRIEGAMNGQNVSYPASGSMKMAKTSTRL